MMSTPRGSLLVVDDDEVNRNSCRFCSVYCLDNAQEWGIANLIYL